MSRLLIKTTKHYGQQLQLNGRSDPKRLIPQEKDGLEISTESAQKKNCI